MRGTRGNGQVIVEAKIIATALFVSLFIMFIFPVAVHAQAVPPTDTTTQTPTDDTTETVNEPTEPTDPAVQAPGTPVVTSPSDDLDIVWEWTPPQDGVTPGAPTAEQGEPAVPADPLVQPTEPLDPVVAEQHPTDIIEYGYELTDQGIIVAKGTVDSAVNTVTTTVEKVGIYVFKLWSIPRVGLRGDAVSTTVTIINPAPTLPTYSPIEIPVAIGATPSTDIPTIGQIASNNATYYTSATPTVASLNDSTADANVLSDTDTNISVPQAEVAAVVAPSNQGWMIVGLPWYVWLLAVAVIYTAWRWFAMVAKNRQ